MYWHESQGFKKGSIVKTGTGWRQREEWLKHMKMLRFQLLWATAIVFEHKTSLPIISGHEPGQKLTDKMFRKVVNILFSFLHVNHVIACLIIDRDKVSMQSHHSLLPMASGYNQENGRVIFLCVDSNRFKETMADINRVL